MHSTKRRAFAAGSVANLKSQWKKYAEFCVYMGQCVMPISTENLCLYVQFLSRSLSCPGSIQNYVSGLKCLHELLSLPFPSTKEMAL